MHRRPLLELLARYAALHPDEEGCVELVRSLALAHPDCFERRCHPGLLTGSAWVLSADRRRFLRLDRRAELKRGLVERFQGVGPQADTVNVGRGVEAGRAFLPDDVLESRYVTGRILHLDGGRHLQ